MRLRSLCWRLSHLGGLSGSIVGPFKRNVYRAFTLPIDKQKKELAGLGRYLQPEFYACLGRF